MEEKTRAVVLHVRRCNGDKGVATLYTEQRGAMVFIAKSGRGRGAKMHTMLLRPLNIVEVCFSYRPKSQLQQLGEIQLVSSYQSLPYDPIKSVLALFLSEALYYTLRNEVKNEALFEYLCYSLLWLDHANRGLGNFHLAFLLRITRFLGFWPDDAGWFEGAFYDLQQVRYCDVLSARSPYLLPSEARLLPHLLRIDFPNMHVFRFSREERQRMLQVLLDYYRLHVPEFPELKSVAVLQDVLG